MSPSKRQTGPEYPFRIQVVDYSGMISEDAKITVYNGWDEVEAEENGQVHSSLPKGLYTVRIEHADVISEKVLRHDGGTNESIPQPQRQSAMPVFNTATTHEYYAFTSQEWSGKDTRDPIGVSLVTQGRLFIFIRALSAEHYRQQNLAEGLKLLDSHGAVLSAFDEAETERSPYGWLALSAIAESGSYILSYRHGDEPRELPLYVYEGRNTQIFITYRGGLRLETAAILLPSVWESFNPNDRIAQAVDAALSGLQQGEDYLPREAMSMLLHGKFENPMLGLLGAHLLLLRKEPEESTVNIVIDNLRWLLKDSPDVRALELIAAHRFEREPPSEPFNRPPMLRVGLEAIFRLSANYPELVPENSLFERISTRLYVDSPWVMWEPVVQMLEQPTSFAVQNSLEPPFMGLGTPEGELTFPETGWVVDYLKDVIKKKRQSGRILDLKQVASNIDLPVRLIERTYTSLVDAGALVEQPVDDFQRIKGVGQAIEGALKDIGYNTYKDLAQTDEEGIQQIRAKLGRFSGRLDKYDWIQQAKKLSFDK